MAEKVDQDDHIWAIVKEGLSVATVGKPSDVQFQIAYNVAKAGYAAGRQQGLREAAAKCLEVSGWIGAAHGSSIDSALRETSAAITALMEGEGE